VPRESQFSIRWFSQKCFGTGACRLGHVDMSPRKDIGGTFTILGDQTLGETMSSAFFLLSSSSAELISQSAEQISHLRQPPQHCDLATGLLRETPAGWRCGAARERFLSRQCVGGSGWGGNRGLNTESRCSHERVGASAVFLLALTVW